jgi:hypothetical protein
MATDSHLRQAHYLLAARYPGSSPETHFGVSATIMLLLTIASTSALRHFSLTKNRPSKHDSEIFPACVEEFFPWQHVSIKDGEHRPAAERRTAAAKELYEVFRCPLIHSGGMVARGRRIVRLNHVFPGLATFEENEARIAELSQQETLSRQTLLEIDACESTIHSRTLYWCVRKMIEAFAADPVVEADIIRSLDIKPRIIGGA